MKGTPVVTMQPPVREAERSMLELKASYLEINLRQLDVEIYEGRINGYFKAISEQFKDKAVLKYMLNDRKYLADFGYGDKRKKRALADISLMNFISEVAQVHVAKNPDISTMSTEFSVMSTELSAYIKKWYTDRGMEIPATQGELAATKNPEAARILAERANRAYLLGPQELRDQLRHVRE